MVYTSFLFLFSLNIDWFQTLKHSTGAIYLTIQNLRRKERLKRENTVLVGVIPGPHQPSKNVNSYLRPLVDDLKQRLQWKHHPVVLLICVACDIPAAWRVCGYASHNALRGCSKCLKVFPTSSFGENQRVGVTF